MDRETLVNYQHKNTPVSYNGQKVFIGQLSMPWRKDLQVLIHDREGGVLVDQSGGTLALIHKWVAAEELEDWSETK